MRKIFTFAAVAVLALAGCGGGGGGSATVPQPQATAQGTAQPTTSPSSKYVVPTFSLRVPARTGSAKTRSPKYISSATQSVVITLTADSQGIDPTTIAGNPATTSLSPTCGQNGCTVNVNGPPSPPGTVSWRVVTYDNATPANGHAINAGQINNATVTQGQSNAETIVLGAIPASLAFSNVIQGTGWTAGSANTGDVIVIVASDADGNVIPSSQSPSVQYVDATGAPLTITVSDPDTTPYGTCFVANPFAANSCLGGVATSGQYTSPDSTQALGYGGIAENEVLLTASAPGVLSATIDTWPTVNAPSFNASQATPSGVAQAGSPEIDLFNTSGTGSTGSESFTESGWTNSPYNLALTVDASACPSFETISAGTNDTTNGTPITATVTGTPSANSCSAIVSDGLTANPTATSAPLTVTYTTSQVSATGKGRRPR